MVRGIIRKIKQIMPLLLILCLLGGCGRIDKVTQELAKQEDWTPEQTAIEVNEDGTITETLIERLDRDYYQRAELEEMVRSSVAAYNEANGADAITVLFADSAGQGTGQAAGNAGQGEGQAAAGAEQGAGQAAAGAGQADDGLINLQLTYRSGDDYTAYNRVPFCSGSMLEVQMKGFRFGGQFRKVEDGVLTAESISGEEPLSHKEYQVLVTDGSCMVHVPGKVLYFSAGAALVDEYTVQPGEKTETQDAEGKPELYVIYEY